MPELLLAIDVGTTTARAAVFAPDGRLLSLAALPVRSRFAHPGQVEQDAAQIWRATLSVTRRALAGAGRTAADLAAIGVTTQRTSAVVWDRDSGRPLTPLVVWSDLRGEARARALRQAGFTVVAQQAAAKLEGVVADARGSGARRLAWGNIDSYLIFKLSGGAAHVTDRSQAWPTGYLDPRTFGWNAALIEHQRLDPALFPTLVDTRGALATTAVGALGARVPIAADIADQQGALIAHGEAAGVAKLTYGTSGTMDVGTGRKIVARSATAPPFVLSAVGAQVLFCVEGMVLSAGAALDWVREVFRMGATRDFEALAAAESDSGGVAFLPAIGGLGAPYGDPRARGRFTGLSGATRRGHIARAALEGVAFRVREVFDHLHGLADLPPPQALGVDGGLASSDLLLRIQADVLGWPVRRHATLEATACGAALSAGRGVGLLTAADAAAFGGYERDFEPTIGAEEAQARLAIWKGRVYPAD